MKLQESRRCEGTSAGHLVLISLRSVAKVQVAGLGNNNPNLGAQPLQRPSVSASFHAGCVHLRPVVFSVHVKADKVAALAGERLPARLF